MESPDPEDGYQGPGPSRTENNDKLELFPTPSTKIPKRTRYDYSVLSDIFGQVDIHPVIPYMDHQRVYIKEIKWNEKVVENLNRLVKDAGKCTLEERPKSWDKIAKALKDENKKSITNLDRRLSYVYNDHYFLTKSGFTFGLRTVSEGIVHLYQITTRPLHFYFQPRDGRYRFKMGQRMLPVEEHRKYRHIILKSNTAYRVTAGTSYVLIVSQKAFFSLHVLPNTMRLPFQTVDPVEEFRAIQRERRTAVQYDIPPPTPNLLERPEPQQSPPPLLEEPIFQIPQQPPPAYEELYPLDPEPEPQQPLQPEPQHPLQPELQQPLQPEPLQPEPQQPLQPEPQQPLQPEPQQPLQPEPLQPEQLQPEPQQPPLDPEAEPILKFYLYEYPMETYVNIVSPQMVKWYHSLKKTLGPNDFLPCQALKEFGGAQTEPLDLSTRPAAQAASTSEPATQPSEDLPSEPAAQPSEEPPSEPAAQPSEPAAQPSEEPPSEDSEPPSEDELSELPSEDELSGPPSEDEPSGSAAGLKRRSGIESIKKKKRISSEERLENFIFPTDELDEIEHILSQNHPDVKKIYNDLCKNLSNVL